MNDFIFNLMLVAAGSMLGISATWYGWFLYHQNAMEGLRDLFAANLEATKRRAYADGYQDRAAGDFVAKPHGITSANFDGEGWAFFNAAGDLVDWPEHWPDTVNSRFLKAQGVEVAP